jgi:large subunit ribosomal protein L23
MDISTIILKPVMTEKSLARPGRYTFLVDRRATKPQIKAAVEVQFSVSPIKVNTLINKSEVKKKAVVTLAKGQKIEELEAGKKK